MSGKKHVLVIDDDSYICNLLKNFLTQNNFEAEAVLSASNAFKRIDTKNYDLVLCDFRLPDSDGLKILRYIKSTKPSIPVIIITAYTDVKMAVELIKAGAFDYVTKPIQPDELLQVIGKVFEREPKETKDVFEKVFILGENKKMMELMDHVHTVAPTNFSVLIEGETGSGKEFIARAIHYASERYNKPFIAVDCGAIPNELANSELFGHIKGSFTGAIKDKTGVFEEAKGGTLFLDEVGNLSYEVQVKLLRAIQERIISKVGDVKTIPVDVRIIAASNVDIQVEVDKNNFRKDLYHRLNEFKLLIPPLRERKDDIPVFTDHFINLANQRIKKNIRGINPSMIQIIKNYPWPGNLRELRNVINRAVLMAKEDMINYECLPQDILNYDMETNIKNNSDEEGNNRLKDASRDFERTLIQNALSEANYNKSKAARMLNIDRKTLYNKISLYNIGK
jgi:two-component system, NtrC family, response regulator HydG